MLQRTSCLPPLLQAASERALLDCTSDSIGCSISNITSSVGSTVAGAANTAWDATKNATAAAGNYVASGVNAAGQALGVTNSTSAAVSYPTMVAATMVSAVVLFYGM